MASSIVVGLSKIRTRRAEGGGGDDGLLPLPRFVDHGETGFYDGGLLPPPSSTSTSTTNTKMIRHGRGKMYYDSGNYYEGGFVENVYHGTGGIYRWVDGDEQKGGWKDGKRHGICVFSSYADGVVEYCNYDMDVPVGEGVCWSADRNEARRMNDGMRGDVISGEDAMIIARTRFGMSVPEPAATTTTTTTAVGGGASSAATNGSGSSFAASSSSESAAGWKPGFFARLFSNRKVGRDGKLMFKDNGDWGTYEGNVDVNDNRVGVGTMTYDSGSRYAGGFVNDKYHCDEGGVYRWADGDMYEGGWKDGERHGIGKFTTSDGIVEISTYVSGMANGEGVRWSANRKISHRTVDGATTTEMTIDESAKFVSEKFDVSVPEPFVVVADATTTTTTTAEPVPEQPPTAATTASSSKAGLFATLFSRRKVGPDGRPMFKDHGEWGSHEGGVDEKGDRQGNGRTTYADGSYYEGCFADDKYHGDGGVYRWADGDMYEGSWKDGERHGVGIFRMADGTVSYSMYETGVAKGEGVVWSPDRKTVYKTTDEVKTMMMLDEEAAEFAKDKFNLPVPEPYKPVVTQAAAEPTPSKTGLFGKLFSKQKVDSDGRPMFKDYGQWGTYEGVIDKIGKRQGNGKMTYANGAFYEGGFVDDKFHGDKGVFHWADGDEYDGSWKDGERHGVGKFTKADGTVSYSTYDAGVTTGESVKWSADRNEAYKTMSDGNSEILILCDEAAEFAKNKFNLPVPEPYKPVVTQAAAVPTSSKSGLFGKLFSKQKVGPDGRPMFKDYGQWGTYEGDVDESGNRKGDGKITYVNGSYYEGGFVDDKFHGDKGVFRWEDGDEYEGGWKDGERHGVGIFRSADGTVSYSMYDTGVIKGEAVVWSADRKTAHKKADGKKMNEISFGLAEKLAKEIFHLPVPEPSTTVFAPANAVVSKPGLFKRLFSSKSVGPDGRLMFKDHGVWGTYEGDVDESGNRKGNGKMTYANGNYYEGGFVDDKFHGDKGVYREIDGDEYEGGWKDGEQHGVGIIRKADGTAEIFMYEMGAQKGEGLSWSADRKTVHKTVEGMKTTEMLVEEAAEFAKEKFDLPVPEPYKPVSTLEKAVPTSSKTGFFATFFANRKVGPNGKLMFKDHGDWGSYEGEVDESGNRKGNGKMTYASGCYYEGCFVNDKFHGDKGVYRWVDGDEYEGGWKDGERYGVGIFRKADGTAEMAMYDANVTEGDILSWSADRKVAFKTVGLKKQPISISMAEKLAKDMFGLPAPARSTLKGEIRFEDHGDVGTYEGDLVNGLRQGQGKMSYDSGNSYEGDFSNGKFDGNRGSFCWADGTQYEGSWKDGLFDGVGIFRIPDVGVDYSIYKEGYATGVGVFWNVDYTKAFHTLDGVKMTETSLADAQKLAKAKFGLPTPKRGVIPSSGEKMQKKKVGADGKPFFKDYGVWGSYEGEVDMSGERVGNGKMTYGNGSYYEGGFVDDKFHGDKGVYHWFDGDEYKGGWKDGERHGVGIFRKADGTVEYSMYDTGVVKGEAVVWSADRKTAHKKADGKKMNDISLGMAEKSAKERFGLPVPEPFTAVSTQVAAVPTSSNTGFFSRFFSNRKVGPDGRTMFKDHGEWGTYEGDVDEKGNRHGKGKMTYTNGDYYEGGFVDDKFHGDKGVYHWFDGDEYEGGWKDGERHGVGKFTNADGTVEISMYEGVAKGEGVLWSADRKTTHKTVNGTKTTEMTTDEAAKFAKESFDVPVPEPIAAVSAQEVGAVVPATSSKTGFFARLFSNRKIGPDGRPMFRDHGVWGTYEGDVDEKGNRTGNGKLTYAYGAVYEGGFVDDKFHGNKGVYRWADGDEYEGEWKDGDRHGVGKFTAADGTIAYSMYDSGMAKGEGVLWSADRKTVYKTVDGTKTTEMTTDEAAKFAKESFDVPVPEPIAAVSAQATAEPVPESLVTV